jgi:zinc protease
VNFSIRIKGGGLLDNPEKPGIANMITDIMQEGTKNKTPEELEDAIGQIGASIGMYTGNEEIVIYGNCLARYFDESVALIEEMLLEPRWDEEEFNRIKNAQINNIKQRNSNPNAIAASVANKITYGDQHIFSKPLSGTVESVEAITIDDLKAFYERNFSPSISSIQIAGSVTEENVKKAFDGLTQKWKSKEVEMPSYEMKGVDEQGKIYFANFSDAKQSVIRMQRLAVDRSHPDYYPLTVANYGLGGNSGGKLFQVMREEKGYTYGAYSNLSSSTQKAPFAAYSSVKTNTTPESVATFKEVIEDYKINYTEEELDKARTALIRKEARDYETLGQKLNVLQQISSYGLPTDFIQQNQAELKAYTVEDMKRVMDTYMNVDQMNYFIVGDAKTQLEGVKNLNLKEVVKVDEDGNTIDNKIESM